MAKKTWLVREQKKRKVSKMRDETTYLILVPAVEIADEAFFPPSLSELTVDWYLEDRNMHKKGS